MPDTTIHFPEERNIEALFSWAEEHFEYDKDKVRAIMRYYNIEGYNPDKWWTCTGLLRHYHTEEVNYRLYPDVCPICEAEVKRDSSKDGLFGVIYGWACTEDAVHFMLHRVNELRRRIEERKANDGRTELTGEDNLQS